MFPVGFCNLIAHLHGGIQIGHGVLENDGDLITTNSLHDFFAGADQFLVRAAFDNLTSLHDNDFIRRQDR